VTSTKWQSIKLVAKNVLRKPATFAIVVGSTALSLMVGDPWPLAAGGAVEAGIFLYYLNNENNLRQALREEHQRIRDKETEALEDVLNSLDPESRYRIRNIMQLQREITQEAEDPEVARYAEGTLQTSVAQVNSLADQAIRLAQKKRELQRYLDKNEEKSIARYIEDLQQKLESATDPVTQSQYQQALAAKTHELEDSRAINQAAKRLEGQLETIECSFSGLKARIVRLKSAEITQLTTAWEQMGQELQTLSTDMDTLEKSVNEALAI
jgi:DNA repair exonuclease SbcCD ATPase subunit